jgi:hypothetical protein
VPLAARVEISELCRWEGDHRDHLDRRIVFRGETQGTPAEASRPGPVPYWTMPPPFASRRPVLLTGRWRTPLTTAGWRRIRMINTQRNWFDGARSPFPFACPTRVTSRIGRGRNSTACWTSRHARQD